VRDTILHEIAHAKAPFDKHGKRWKAIAKFIGCKPVACYDRNDVKTPTPFVGVCPGCGRRVYRYRRENVSCGRCHLESMTRAIASCGRSCHRISSSRCSTMPTEERI
jgi:predicted SprT family Zn-dependent metalloprotease